MMNKKFNKADSHVCVISTQVSTILLIVYFAIYFLNLNLSIGF